MSTTFRREAARWLGVPESQVASFGGTLKGRGCVAVARVMTRREMDKARREERRRGR